MNSELWNDIRNHPVDGTPVLVWDLHREEAVLASWMDHEGEWGIEDAQGRISRVDASFKAAAWMIAPLPPRKSPDSVSINGDPGETRGKPGRTWPVHHATACRPSPGIRRVAA